MTNSITILTTIGPTLTKTFKADGTVEAYDDAASFKVQELAVGSISDLSSLLTKLQVKPKKCVIRGKFVGAEKAEKGNVEATFKRVNVNFDDQALHWMCIDVDGYRPGFADPVHDPVDAIQDYIRDCLPPAFQDVSFHWQLSSSAGQPGKEGVLKVHLWFWLETPYTSAQLYAWAKALGPVVDKAVYRRVQIHYTANPIFEEGVPDPVPVRSGLYQGSRDDVPLVLTEATLEQARETGGGASGHDMKLKDPSEKEGLIGLFHRVFTAEQVLSEILKDEFEPGSSERRWTWVDGGGTPEGVWVHDDGMHVHAVHNTWPIDGIANLWDLVRIFKFGPLDDCDSDDALEQLDAETGPIQAKPSHLAMLEWAGSLDEIKAAIAEEREEAVQPWLNEIAAAQSIGVVEAVIAPRIREAEGLSRTDRERLAIAIQGKARETAQIRLPIAQARAMIAPPRRRVTREDAPEWAQKWVWVRELDKFMNIDTKMTQSERSYNAGYDRYMARFADENGVIPRASEMALNIWDTKVFDRVIYYPREGWEFWLNNQFCLNTYREDLLPSVPDEYTRGDLKAIATVEAHAELIVPDARERSLFLDWIAFCVQNPGVKIRWAVLLKGIPGDGKTAFAMLMAACMGDENVRSLSSNTLEGSDFSGLAAGQCVVAIEEVKIQGMNRHDVYNKLKPYITNDVVEIHPKGQDPKNVPNTSNYFLLTNHNDALPIDENDRRVMPVWSPFVTKEQLFKEIRSRFDLDPGEYFDRLFDRAIKAHPGGLRKWLLARELSPEFKADGRAPITSVRSLMVDISKGEDELAVEDCLREGGEGVYQDVVSVTHLRLMVNRRFDGLDVRTRRISNVMANLGYTPFKRFLWKGKDSVVYVRGEAGRTTEVAQLRDHMDQLEANRLEMLLEDDFRD